MDEYIELAESPLAPGVSPVRLRCREFGAGAPLLILHGGWGYDVYPFDRQIAALAPMRRVIVPDRSGYGGSGRLRAQPSDFHRRAAVETCALMDALALDRPILWGHSDGAVIALLMALRVPERIRGVIIEATHVFRRKPASRAFFELMRDNPDGLGERVTSTLAREHGDSWRQLISINGDAWLRLAAQGGDLYDGRLSSLRVPAMVIHGARDPRTEPGELDALCDALTGRSEDLRYFRPASVVARAVAQDSDPASVMAPAAARDPGPASVIAPAAARDSPPASVMAPAVARDPGPASVVAPLVAQDFSPAVRFVIIPGAGHSPHSERATAGEVTRAAVQFISGLASDPAVPAARS